MQEEKKNFSMSWKVKGDRQSIIRLFSWKLSFTPKTQQLSVWVRHYKGLEGSWHSLVVCDFQNELLFFLRYVVWLYKLIVLSSICTS